MTTLRMLRDDIPVLRRQVASGEIIYLDNAATTLTPEPVIDAIAEYYRTASANIHRGQHQLSAEASERYEQVRAEVADFLGVPARNTVFTAGTTAGLNLVAGGIEPTEGRVVALPIDSHYSAQLPWRSQSQVCWFEAESEDASATYLAALERSPAIVAITACSNVTGRQVDLTSLAEQAHDAGALTVVDGAQLVPHNTPAITSHIDALAFSAHKMLGPTGIGVLYLSDRMIDRIGTPATLGGGTVQESDLDDFELRPAPYRFEAGTPNIGGVYGLGAALSYLHSMNIEVRDVQCKRLHHAMVEEASDRAYLRIIGGVPNAASAPILTMSLSGIDDHAAVADALSNSYGVMCRAGYFCSQPYFVHYRHQAAIRLSAYLYNTEDEIRLAFQAIDRVWSELRTS